MKKYIGYILTIFVLIIPFIGTTAFAVTGEYYIYDDFGGTWYDAEKDNVSSDDDLMCWAAATANMLMYTGWYTYGPEGADTTDEIFDYFCDHWTDVGGSMMFGIDWWWDGTNNSQGIGGWSQVDVAGGGFYPDAAELPDFYSIGGRGDQTYFNWTFYDDETLTSADAWMKDGMATGLGITNDTYGHAITLWGFEYDTEDPDYYTGIYVTDSDNSMGGPDPRPDTLNYHSIVYDDGNDRWKFSGGSYNNWYISEVHSLGFAPGVPEPGTWAIFFLGFLCGALKMRKNFFPKK